jgi:hypothetical protein
MTPLKLIQKTSLFSKFSVSINEKHEIAVEQVSLFRSVRASFSMDRVSPTPIHVRSIPIPWVITTAILMLLLSAAIIAGWTQQNTGEQFGIIFLAGIVLACTYNTIKLSQNALHFKDSITGDVLFTISREKPSEKIVDDFIASLEAKINSYRTPISATSAEAIAIYKKHLDFLLENSVISHEEYENIVGRLSERREKAKVFELVK